MPQSKEDRKAWRASQKKKGLCAWCIQKAEPGKTYCKKHAEVVREKQRAFRIKNIQIKRENGICEYSGCSAERMDGNRFCGYHDELVSDNRAKRYSKNVERGLCRCGRPKKEGHDQSGKAYIHCIGCLASRSASEKRRRENSNCCVDCGRPRKRGLGHNKTPYARCEVCLEKRRRYNAEYKRSRKAARLAAMEANSGLLE